MKPFRMNAVDAILLASLVLPIAGCSKGGLGGGASVEPTVTLKSSAKSTDSTGSKTESNGGTTAPAEGYGTLTGKIVLTGSAPSLPPLITKGKAPRDPQVCATDMDIPDQSLVVSPAGEIANIFVFLDKAPSGAKPIPEEELVFDQKSCTFKPHCMIAFKGETVLVKNDDAIGHNTHAFPNRQSGFNATVASNDRVGVPLVYAVEEREPFPVKCDIHAWMQAFHLVIDHPYGAVTADDGTFTIPDLPAGKHKLKIWHEKAGGKGGFLDRGYEVTIEPDKPTDVKIEYTNADFGV